VVVTEDGRRRWAISKDKAVVDLRDLPAAQAAGWARAGLACGGSAFAGEAPGGRHCRRSPIARVYQHGGGTLIVWSDGGGVSLEIVDVTGVLSMAYWTVEADPDLLTGRDTGCVMRSPWTTATAPRAFIWACSHSEHDIQAWVTAWRHLRLRHKRVQGEVLAPVTELSSHDQRRKTG
jgi:hypothetical protein